VDSNLVDYSTAQSEDTDKFAVKDEQKVQIEATVNSGSNVQISNPTSDLYVRKSANSKYIIEYHRDRCEGAGTCAAIAGNTFIMNADNIAELVNNSNEADPDDIILAAAQSCPVFAIVVRDADTGKQIFPPAEDED
jgi:ferredoxin